ncbi:hypothetical protein ZIOFF_047492 [Zingiber officinale]|uniref:Uncharacterized protein n=1 Tax=Zingiber officinale TaxID=94328 RepID=A0A8J5KWS7_ZINOF|nr:hypothetical protein ZIOFF_047492 [Zingiber officinale]
MVGKESSKCDVSQGEWVPNPNALYYTNDTYWVIHEHHNYLKYEGPDDRKKSQRPKVRKKKVVVVVTSVDVVEVEAMAGALLEAEEKVKTTIKLLKIANGRKPFEKKAIEKNETWHLTTLPDGHKFIVIGVETVMTGDALLALHSSLEIRHFLEYTNWSREVAQFDYMIISIGQPFLHPTMFYENRCCWGATTIDLPISPDLTKYYGYCRAFHIVLRVFTDDLRGFGGMVFLCCIR